MNQSLYILEHNIDQKPFDSETAFELKIPNPAPINNDRIWAMSRDASDISQLPTFYSFLELFDSIDFPTNDQALTIFSRAAVKAIDSHFPNHKIEFREILIVDGLLREDDPREGLEDDIHIISTSLKNSRFFSNEYYVANIPILNNLLDLDKSEYYARSNNIIGIVYNYVLRERYDKLPPLFRLAENTGTIFILKELRELWKMQGITGTAYSDISDPLNSYQIDVEVPNPNIPE